LSILEDTVEEDLLNLSEVGEGAKRVRPDELTPDKTSGITSP